jgi:hypothetical protein
MSSGITHNIVIDDRLESYTSFFDHAWARNIDTLAAGTKLELPVFNLCINWKAAVNNCIGPWLICSSVSGFAGGFARHREPLAVELINAFATRIPNEMPSLTHNR